MMKITKNSGEEMTAWFDVLAPWPVTPSWKNDTAGIASSVETVHRLIDRLVSEEGIPCERIIIGGFSQGAVLAFASVYSFRKRLGGCMMLSGWIDLETAAASDICTDNIDTPLFWGHGVEDEIVTLENQTAGTAFLREKAGLSSVLAKQYAVGHDITEEEAGDAVVFVTTALSS
jgi:predicted esterase